MSPRTKKKSVESENVTLAGIFNHLEKTKDSHYSFNDPIDYYVSSGSLNLDLAMGAACVPVLLLLLALRVEENFLCIIFCSEFPKAS